MTTADVQKIGIEIAMLGRKGLDVNDVDTKHPLKSLPGTYTSLQLVSIMYVAFHIIAPGADIGFDLSRELEVAKSLLKGH